MKRQGGPERTTKSALKAFQVTAAGGLTMIGWCECINDHELRIETVQQFPLYKPSKFLRSFAQSMGNAAQSFTTVWTSRNWSETPTQTAEPLQTGWHKKDSKNTSWDKMCQIYIPLVTKQDTFWVQTSVVFLFSIIEDTEIRPKSSR